MFGQPENLIGTITKHNINRKNLEIQATSLFTREISRAHLDSLLARISGRSMRLMDLSSIRPHDPTCPRAPLGSHTVPIDRIRGSENRCEDFDSNLRPLHDEDRQRWINVAIAALSGASLPAVDLIQVCGFYFIRDGHHRISVARALGASYIDATVQAG